MGFFNPFKAHKKLAKTIVKNSPEKKLHDRLSGDAHRLSGLANGRRKDGSMDRSLGMNEGGPRPRKTPKLITKGPKTGGGLPPKKVTVPKASTGGGLSPRRAMAVKTGGGLPPRQAPRAPIGGRIPPGAGPKRPKMR